MLAKRSCVTASARQTSRSSVVMFTGTLQVPKVIGFVGTGKGYHFQLSKKK